MPLMGEPRIESPQRLKKGRLDAIFEADLLKKGITHEEVEAELGKMGLDRVAPPRPTDEVLWEIGERAVGRVLEAISKHPRLFNGYRVTMRKSDEDSGGKDVVVDLTRVGRLADSSDEIYIQVKSSGEGVADFRKETSMSKGRVSSDRVKAIGLERAIDEYFFDERIVVISAGANDDVDENLMKGYRELCSYWATKVVKDRRR